MRDETASEKVIGDGAGPERSSAALAGYGERPPDRAPESFAYVRTDDPRKMKLVYDDEVGAWIQVGSDSMREVAAE